MVLFYLWLAVSVVILVQRVITRRRRRTPVARTAPGAPIIPADWAPPDQPLAPPEPGVSPGPAASPDPVVAPRDPASPVVATPTDRPPANWPPAPAQPGTTPPPRPPGLSSSAAATRPGAGSASLMEALAGITLPCDLVPLTSAEGRVLGNRDLLLITSGHSGFEVGRALGQAIEALGYTLTPMANNDLVAVRGNDRITIDVHEHPEALLSGKRQEFPTAKAGDVVVELRL